MRKLSSILILAFVFISAPSFGEELQGFLFKPEILSADFSEDAPQAKEKILVYEKPLATSKKIAEISRQRIHNTKGKTLHLPEMNYEELAIPVFETKSDWFFIGLAEKEKEHLSLDGPYPVRGWVTQKGLSFKNLSQVLEESLTELSGWNGELFKSPGGTEKTTVPLPRPEILGKARLKPDRLQNTKAKECEIPFTAKESSGPSTGICPQNFESFVKGIKCGSDNLSQVFCLDVIILAAKGDRYQVALTEDTLDLKKISLESGFSRDPNFNFVTAWTEQKNFEALQTISPSEQAAVDMALFGMEVQRPSGVDIVETKKLPNGELWLKVKIKEHCSGNDKIHGEGWLPLRTQGKIQFSTFSRGC